MQKSSSAPVSLSSLQNRSNLLLIIGSTVLLLIGLALTVPTQPDWWKVVILGIVEGLTEFLPISSTGHLLIVSRLIRFENSIGGTFEIFIQLGAILAVVGFYLRDLLQQARAIPTDAGVRRFWLAILVAFLPAAVVGLTLHGWIKQVLFDAPSVIAASLIIGGIIFIIIERMPRRPPKIHSEQATPLAHAFMIGVAQVMALVPGVSRSGASIIGGMLAGLDRRAATAFSFYLAIPTLGAATVVDLLGSLDQLTPGDMGRLFLGTVVSMIVAWLSIGWLLRYVANNSFVAFGVYRIGAGIVILALVALGWM